MMMIKNTPRTTAAKSDSNNEPRQTKQNFIQFDNETGKYDSMNI